ncbi:hypothetical protein AAFF_G00295500 [Aldrovandia affinis]|uniref:Uncharacterized protein n=1 Tax=Aldrovandia affinis TaxID=143900 RepID=A0AAD7R8Z7_9TELE|nr:hypothetical protein AAFF_G00295500 [Aldrovandia affinis]
MGSLSPADGKRPKAQLCDDCSRFCCYSCRYYGARTTNTASCCSRRDSSVRQALLSCRHSRTEAAALLTSAEPESERRSPRSPLTVPAGNHGYHAPARLPPRYGNAEADIAQNTSRPIQDTACSAGRNGRQHLNEHSAGNARLTTFTEQRDPDVVNYRGRKQDSGRHWGWAKLSLTVISALHCCSALLLCTAALHCCSSQP